MAEDKKGPVALLFSGGLDSTTAALRLSETHERVHLLTFSRGYGHYFLDTPGRRADELRKAVGDRFEYELIDIKPLFEKVVLPTIVADYKKYRSGFVFCLGCKVCMHAQAVAWCREHDVKLVADGSSGDTSVFVEQRPSTLRLIIDFYREHGIEFFTPVFEQTREEKRRFLKSKGVGMGTRIGDRHIGVQPKCVPGELYYLPTVLFGIPPKHEDESIAEFFAEKAALAREVLGLDVDEGHQPRGEDTR